METQQGAPSGATVVAETETVSATRAAADTGDVSKFLEADRAAKGGKPLDAVTRPKVGKDGAPAKGPTAADRDADERLTARIRDAVDTSTAQLKSERDDLRRRLDEATRKPAGTEEKKAPASGTPEHRRYLSMPDAPKLEDFDSVVEHNAAMGVFISDKRHEEREAARVSSDRELQRVKSGLDRVKSFHGRIEAFKGTNPDFGTKLSPEVKALHGFGRLQEINAERQTRGESPIAASVDHAIAEELYDSEAPAQVAVYLSEHPEELAALRGAGDPRTLTRLFTKIEAKASGGQSAETPKPPDKQPTPAELRERADAVVDRSVSKANPPAPNLGKPGSGVDPIRKAVETGDIGMFLELDRADMAERRGLRR